MCTLRKQTVARKSAFTLLELLIVVALIALLAALLAPAVQSARRAARSMICQSNLRQVGVAWRGYLEDSHGWFPRYRQNIQWFYGGNHPGLWRDAVWTLDFRPINPYLVYTERQEARAGVFRCPADRGIQTPEGQPGPTQGHTAYAWYGNSFPMNSTLLIGRDPQTNAIQWGPLHVNRVEVAHARMVLAGDCQWYYTVNDFPWDANFHDRVDQMNLLFLDGHAAWVQLTRGQAIGPDYSFLVSGRTPPDDM